MTTLSPGPTAGQGLDEFMLHAIEEMERTWRQIVADARLLSKLG